MKISLIGIVLAMCSCTSVKIIKTYEDNYNYHNTFKGGTFSYESEDLLNNRYLTSIGLKKAAEFCGTRSMLPWEESSSTSTYTSYIGLPTNGSFDSKATNSSNGNVTNITGSSTGTQYVPIQHSSTQKYQDFLCMDSDRVEPVYVLVYSNESPPKCLAIPNGLAPGEKRLSNLASMENSKDCRDKEGWISYFDNRKIKDLYFYIGKKGLESCRKVEDYLIKNQVIGLKIEYVGKQFDHCDGSTPK